MFMNRAHHRRPRLVGLPPKKMPAQQHEATGETHTTEPYLLNPRSYLTLVDTPNSHWSVSKDQHPVAFCALGYGESKILCGSAITIWGLSTVISRRKGTDVASLQPHE